MIRTLTYRGRLDGKDPVKVSAAVEEHVSRLIRTRNTLRGVRCSWDSEVIDVSLRMSGVDRWRISREARKIGSFILATQRLAFERPLNPVLEVTEPSARNLVLEQGRTPQSVKGGRGRKRRAAATPGGS